jgi:Icc-related predicted phosphoesterase
MKKIVAISDTHGLHNDIIVPECDILIFAGDFDIMSADDLQSANIWFGRQKATKVIFCAGNHDVYLEKVSKDYIKKIFTNVIYLEDELVEIDGIRIYGSPRTPYFNGWAFMYQRCSLEAKEIWEKIPENLDFLITHGPSYGIRDKNLNSERCGCKVLSKEIMKKKPLRHVFGHIHGEYGCCNDMGIDFFNVSVLNEDYNLVNPVTIIGIEK